MALLQARFVTPLLRRRCAPKTRGGGGPREPGVGPSRSSRWWARAWTRRARPGEPARQPRRQAREQFEMSGSTARQFSSAEAGTTSRRVPEDVRPRRPQSLEPSFSVLANLAIWGRVGEHGTGDGRDLSIHGVLALLAILVRTSYVCRLGEHGGGLAHAVPIGAASSLIGLDSDSVRLLGPRPNDGIEKRNGSPLLPRPSRESLPVA
jgi:hypothetical protein